MASGVSGYDSVADEYYDRRAHPTAWALGEASTRLLRRWADELLFSGVSLDLGAGRGTHLARPGLAVRVDGSERMLATASFPGSAVVADARRLPFRDESVDGVIAALADPFNVAKAWSEAVRVMKPSARAVVTMPSHEWATAWRLAEGTPESVSRFVLADQSSLDLPSFVLPATDQEELFLACGLVVEDTHAERATPDERAAAPKARAAGDRPLVRGWVLARAT